MGGERVNPNCVGSKECALTASAVTCLHNNNNEGVACVVMSDLIIFG